MDQYFIPTVFFTLFFVVDPLGLIPIFISYLTGREGREKKRIIIKATIISILISTFFILFGRYLLLFLGISTGAFLVAGGILLFLISIEMLFGLPSRAKVPMSCEDGSAVAQESPLDVAVFPLAIPMLCGPGNIAALIMFGSQASGDITRMVTLIAISASVFLIAMVTMFFSRYIESFLGDTGISILQRLIGLILSALSVQIIKNGLAGMGILS